MSINSIVHYTSVTVSGKTHELYVLLSLIVTFIIVVGIPYTKFIMGVRLYHNCKQE